MKVTKFLIFYTDHAKVIKVTKISLTQNVVLINIKNIISGS